MANEPVKFLRGLETNLPTTYAVGSVYVTTDSRKIFIDTSASSSGRLQIGNIDDGSLD